MPRFAPGAPSSEPSTQLIAAFSFAQLSTSPLWGKLSDRYGRRPVLLIALSASGIAFLIFALADSIWLLFVSRLAQGAGGGTTGVAQAYVSDSVGHEERAKALGWLSAATNAGVMIGPAVGALATTLDPRAPGFVAAGLCFLNVLFAWRWLPESSHAADRVVPPRGSTRRALKRVLHEPGAPVSALIWIYAAGMMAFFAMNGVLALYLGRRFGVTDKTIGWFFVYVGAISLLMRTLILGPAVRRFGERGVMRLGILALSGGLLAIPIPHRIYGFALAVWLIPVGTALLFPATSSLISRFAPKKEVGQTLGLQQSFGGVSRMLGPVWAGALFDHVSLAAPFWTASALMASTTLFLAPVERALAPAPQAPEPSLEPPPS